jgi:hypothetical protein
VSRPWTENSPGFASAKSGLSFGFNPLAICRNLLCSVAIGQEPTIEEIKKKYSQYF